jgi:hypothetical protein
MALSGVGVAFSVGVGEDEAVCAEARKSKLKTATIVAATNKDPITHRSSFKDRLARPIAISSFSRLISRRPDREHRRRKAALSLTSSSLTFAGNIHAVVVGHQAVATSAMSAQIAV